MSTEILGLVGIVLWVMVMLAQLRKRSAAGSVKMPPSRRSRLHSHRS